MAKIYYQQDCNLSFLDGKTVAVIAMAVRVMHTP